jgi:curved DNA-binding protein CbpA
MTKVYKKAILKYHPDRTSKNFSLIEKVTHEEIFKVLQTSFQTYK